MTSHKGVCCRICGLIHHGAIHYGDYISEKGGEERGMIPNKRTKRSWRGLYYRISVHTESIEISSEKQRSARVTLKGKPQAKHNQPRFGSDTVRQ